jgi:hypothetical protein
LTNQNSVFDVNIKNDSGLGVQGVELSYDQSLFGMDEPTPPKGNNGIGENKENFSGDFLKKNSSSRNFVGQRPGEVGQGLRKNSNAGTKSTIGGQEIGDSGTNQKSKNCLGGETVKSKKKVNIGGPVAQTDPQPDPKKRSTFRNKAQKPVGKTPTSRNGDADDLLDMEYFQQVRLMMLETRKD